MERDLRCPESIRFPMHVPALVESVPNTGSPCAGEATDLSRSGMLLRLRQQAQCGSWVRVTLRLRQRMALTLTGTVQWVRPDQAAWELGIQFSKELADNLITAIAEEESHPRARDPKGLAEVS